MRPGLVRGAPPLELPRALALVLAFACSAAGAAMVACGGQKTEATTPVPSASSSTVAPVASTSVAAPVGDGGVGQIDPGAVRGVIRAATARFMICYIAGLKKDKKLAGRVETKFVIDETGHVISAEDVTHSNVLPDDATRDCIVSKFKQLEFPPPQPSGKVPITYPLLLDPSMVQLATAPDAGAPVDQQQQLGTGEVRAFNAANVAGALSKVNPKGCGFHGSAHAKLTFDPTGAISKIDFDSPASLVGSPLGVCLAKAYGAARVPPFDGSAVTISKSITVP